MQLLTEEEAFKHDLQLEKNADDWWNLLSLKEKKNIHQYHKDMIDQIRCSHEYKFIDYYSSKLEQCTKCSYTRTIQESRDNKINNII